jgi:hypothetical protein
MSLDIRRQVIAQIVAVMERAEERGEDPCAAAAAAFPGTPYGVIFEASCELAVAKEERWWSDLEATIEGELVRKALESGGAS